MAKEKKPSRAKIQSASVDVNVNLSVSGGAAVVAGQPGQVSGVQQSTGGEMIGGNADAQENRIAMQDRKLGLQIEKLERELASTPPETSKKPAQIGTADAAKVLDSTIDAISRPGKTAASMASRVVASVASGRMLKSAGIAKAASAAAIIYAGVKTTTGLGPAFWRELHIDSGNVPTEFKPASFIADLKAEVSGALSAFEAQSEIEDAYVLANVRPIRSFHESWLFEDRLAVVKERLRSSIEQGISSLTTGALIRRMFKPY